MRLPRLFPDLLLPSPAERAFASLLQRSEALAERTRQAREWTDDPADTALLVRQAISHLIVAVARLDGKEVASWSDGCAWLAASAEHHPLFKGIRDDLPLLDELAGPDEPAGDDPTANRRYAALVARLPRLIGDVRRHGQARQRAAGGRPRLRRALQSLALGGAIGLAFLVSAAMARAIAPASPARSPAVQKPADPIAALPREIRDDPRRCFRGTYHATKYFDQPVTERVDCAIVFDWGTSSVPGIPGFPAEDFSVRWEGVLQVRVTAEYTFYLKSDEGARLYLDEAQLIDQWERQVGKEVASEPIELRAGRPHRLRLDYVQDGGGAAVQLLWSSTVISKRPLTGHDVFAPGPDDR